MKFHGIQLEEGSAVTNMTVASGTSFPGTPNEGELFYRSDADRTIKGMYAYISGSWDRIASSDSVTVPAGVTLPSAANPGDLFYLDTNNSSESLYVYTGTAWASVGNSAGSTGTVTGDVSGTVVIGSSSALTLSTVATAGTSGSASKTVTVTIDAKGRVTSLSDQDIAIAASQVTSGTFADARISQTSVTQHQSAIAIAASQVTSGTFSNSRIAQSNVTQHQAALTILETQITNGTLLARVGDDETISGNWHFNNGFAVDGIVESTIGGFKFPDASVQTYAFNGITLTGDVTGSGQGSLATTLATVNSNTGSFGTASAVPTFTVNGKGLVTAAGSTSIAIAASQVTSGTFADARVAQTNVTQHQAALTILESQITDGSLLARNAGNETITGTWTFNNAVTGAAPTAALHLATKQYVDDIASGVNVHAAVETATTAALPSCTYSNGTSGVGATLTATANGALGTVGGYAGLAVASRVLVKDQATALQNGIYVVTSLGSAGSPWVLTRSSDMDGSPTTEIEAGDMTYVQEGALGGTQWLQVTVGTGHNTSPAYDYVVVGTDSVVFTQFSGVGTITGGTGITVTGNSVAITNVGTAGTYTAVTTNAQGQVTAGANLAATGDVTGTASGSSIALSLPSVGTPVTSSFVKITTDAKGRVSDTTAVTTADITGLVDATYVNVSGDTMTGTLSLPANGLVVGTTQLVAAGSSIGVGISPNVNAKLHVSDASPVTHMSSTALPAAADTRIGLLSFGSEGDATSFGQVRISAFSSAAWTAGTSNPTYLSFSTTPSGSTIPVERMRLDASGSLGIGTTSPTAKFCVSDGASTMFKLSPGSSVSTISSRNSGDTGYTSLVINATQTIFQIAGTEAGRVDVNGNFGLGTNGGAGEKLHVMTGANDASIRLQNTATSNKVWNLTAGGGGNYTAGTFAIRQVTDSLTPFFIDATGNVGVNNTSPSSYGKFAVSGANGTFSVGSGGDVIQFSKAGTNTISASTAGGTIVLQVNGGGATATLETNGNLHLSASANYTVAAGGGFWASGQDSYATGWLEASGAMVFRTATTERLRISSTGVIGINQSSPAANAKLDINGTVAQNITAVAALNMDLSAGTYFTKTVSAATAFTVSNIPASRYVSWLLKLTNGGSAAVTWPTGTKWNGGTAPTLTTAGIDIISFFSDDGGTTIHAFLVSKDSK